jgi:hypothetical protein
MIMLVVYQKLAEFQIQKKVRPVLRRNAFPVEPLQSSLRKITENQNKVLDGEA